MVTDSETRAMREYLFSNPNQGNRAAVWDACLDVKAALCDFLEHLQTALRAKVQEGLLTSPDVRVNASTVGREGGPTSFGSIALAGFRGQNHAKHPPFEGCTAIACNRRARAQRLEVGCAAPAGRNQHQHGQGATRTS